MFFFDADLEYTVSSAGVKENMVLKSAEAPHSFTAHYTVEGLSAVAVDSRTVELRNEAGTVIYTLTAPCMTDAAGAVSTALTYTVTENGTGGFTVCLTADSAWLHSTERVFPVTVDPEISLTGTAAVESTYVDEATPTANHSGDAMMLVGDVAVPVGDGDEWERPVSRALLRIKTLPALSDCDTVVSATLAAYVMVSSGEQYLTAHAVTDNWDVDTVTWNSRIAFGTAVDAQDTSHVPVDETYEGHRYQWDITRLARDWYAGSNTGVMLCSSTEGGTYAAQATVCTARYTGREAVAPVFTVDYRSGTGLEDYWSYVGAEAGRDGTAAVNVFNGNAVVTQPVTLSAGGNRLPVSFTLVYNSNRAGHTMAYSPVGNGWQTNFHVTMTPYDSDGDGSTDGYRLTDSDGTQHAFPVTSAEAYADEDGLGYTLTVQNSGCTVTDRSNNRLAFDEQGFLVSITDASDNEATLQYTALANGNRRLSTVTDGAGRVYTWQYGSGENVQSVRDPSGRVTAFTYADGALTGITYPDGKCVTMAYADGRLSSIAGNDGGTTELTYNADDMYRTACLLRRFGTAVDSKAELAYGLNETVVTDERGQSVRYQLDNYGQTTGVISCEDGSGAFSRYENRNENMLKANKVSQQSVLQQAVINLLPNSGFDSGADGFYTLKNGNSTATFAWDGTRGRTANGSLKVTRSGTPSASGDYAFYACYFDAPKTGWYTLSGYANTAGATIESHGAELRLERWSNGHGTALGGNGYAVNHTEEDEWAYGTVSLFFNAGETVKCLVGMEDAVGVGTAWFDDLQLEYGEAANPYTMLVNGDFTRGTAGWEKQGNGTVTAITDADAPTGKAMQVTGDIREFNWTTQTVQVNGKAGDRYSAGGWGKADSIATEEPSRDIDVNTSFGIQVEFVNGTSFVNTVYIPFNRYVRSWQMATGEAVAQGDYTAVRVRLMYSYNLNTAQFAQLYLHRCSYGQTYEYDEKAQLIRTQGTDNTAMSYTYDDNYNLIQQLTPSGSSYRYDYDEKGRLVSADNTAGSRSAVTYDAFGNVLSSVLTKTALQNGEQYVLRHAATEKVISTASQIAAMAVSGTGSNSPWRLEQHGSNTFRLYSVAGDESGEACTLNKTAADEIAEGDYHLLGVRETNASLFRFVRQDDGQFVLLTAASNYTRCLTVAETGHLTDTLYDEDAVTDAEKWTVENALPSQVQYIQTLASYTSSGNFAATGTDALGNTTSYVYNETTGLLQSVTDASGVTATYTYDSVGRITAVYRNGVLYEAYDYDAWSQLVRVTESDGTVYTYTYTAGGNLSTVSKNGTVVSTYTYGNSAWADQLTAVNGESITYDAAGNPLSYLHGLTMDWENGRYPVRVGNTTFTYAADGTRLSKTVGGITTDYVYVGGRLYGEITGNNRLVYLYDNTAAPYGYLYNDEVYFYERNLQGDVVGLVNENGVRIANYTYTAWGELKDITDQNGASVRNQPRHPGNLNPLRYRGYRYDAEIGLYWLQTRFYDPETGRFVNADAQLNSGLFGNNLYAYCGNDPVNQCDCTGTCACLASDLIDCSACRRVRMRWTTTAFPDIELPIATTFLMRSLLRGADISFGEKSLIAQEIIASSEFKKIYDACFEDFVNSDSDYSVYSDTLYYTIKSNKDLWFAIGQCACVMSFTKVTYSWPWDTCIKYRAEIGIHDIYDFDKREVKDIGDFLNNVAAGLQDRGILYPYSWEINFVKEETWWCV